MTEYLEKVSETEQHFCKVGRDCVFMGKNSSARKALLIASVWNSAEFKALPKRHQSYVTGYIQGIADGAAQLLDEESAPLLERNSDIELPPKEILDLQPGATWHKHPNGGGWVSHSAYVEGSAMVGSRAAVFENARVLDRVRVYGSSRVGGSAECFGAAHVHGRAVLRDSCKVYDAAKVLGDAIVGGSIEIGGTSVVRGTIKLEGSVQFIDEHVSDNDVPKHSYTKELRPKKKNSVRPASRA